MKHSGFSLVELLIATTIGLILISGMIGVFAGNKRSSELNAAMADLQENARFALDLLAEDIRLSGHQGCLDINNGAINTRAKWLPTSDLRSSATTGALVQAGDSWMPAKPSGYVSALDKLPLPGTHALNVQFGGPQVALLSGQMASGTPTATAAINTSTPLEDLRVEDWAVISNCDIGDLFRVTARNSAGTSFEHSSGLNQSGALTLAYGDTRTIGQTTLMKFNSNIYFIAETGQSNEFGDPIRALYRRSLPYHTADINPPTEVIIGIENMRLAFGIREANGSLSYVPPTDPSFDPSVVEAVQIGLLMVSDDRIRDVDDTRTYLLAEQPINASNDAIDLNTHPQDRRFRAVFNTTVKVRNRRNDSL